MTAVPCQLCGRPACSYAAMPITGKPCRRREWEAIVECQRVGLERQRREIADGRARVRDYLAAYNVEMIARDAMREARRLYDLRATQDEPPPHVVLVALAEDVERCTLAHVEAHARLAGADSALRRIAAKGD